MAAEAGTPRPDRVGPYTIVDELGEGGMGIVYLAEQREPVRRRVALKLIRLGMDSAQVLARFELERQALAMMSHPNIAAVFDAGTTERGQPWFAMEYVAGTPLVDFCERQRLTISERLALFDQVCEGVQHAHQKGVIHRDLKPGNILVDERKGRPLAKIIDFGIAKATHQRLVEATLYTEHGQVIGTPEYMSPEQADPMAVDVDTRTDVYSLGVILYELLSGTLPFPSDELRKAGLLEIQRKIREDDPPKPSLRLSTQQSGRTTEAAHHRRTTAAALARSLRGDLDWIVMKAIEKDRNRRYGTPAALAEDLQRFARNEPVSAGPPSASYRLRKFVRKHRGPVLAGSALLSSLLVGLIVSSKLYLETLSLQDRVAHHLANFNRLSDLERLRGLQQEANTALWPAHPDAVEAMRLWVTQARTLVSRQEEHAAALAALRTDVGREGVDARWTFPDAYLQTLHDALALLVDELAAFRDDATSLLPKTEANLEFARTARQRTVDEHAGSWQQAIDAIASSPAYGALRLRPQVGLVPLGADPASGLCEFVHLRSGSIPERNGAGALQLSDDNGIVLVLLPGARFWMGAQREDASGSNYDRAADRQESPVHQVQLAPFFIAKHELTKAQWLRASGREPSFWNRERIGELYSLLQPVEQVSWEEAHDELARLDLDLPTEAQWEYACRAGTGTPWWSGEARESLRGCANLADQSARDSGANWTEINDWPELRDGHPVTAPIGSFRANAFGLHDMTGNVWEWCKDVLGDYDLPTRPDDGLRLRAARAVMVFRGSSYSGTAFQARSAFRFGIPPANRNNNLGLRPIRALRE